jgi:hypothetical protein
MGCSGHGQDWLLPAMETSNFECLEIFIISKFSVPS